MTKTEAHDAGKALFEALPTEQKATCETYLAAYRAIRLREGPFFYISRAAVAKEQGSNSISSSIKYMKIIEMLEGDQPRRRRGNNKASTQDQAATQQHPATVEATLNSLRAAIEAVSKAVAEARTAADAEISAQFQAVLRDQQAAFEAERQADDSRIADLEGSSAVASEECLQARATAEQLGLRLQAAEAERDHEQARAQEARQVSELGWAKLAAAEAQLAAAQERLSLQASEITRLQDERQTLVEAAAESNELRTEYATVRERADGLAHQVGRLESLIVEMDRRHQQEREALRATYEAALAELRRKASEPETKLGWLGVPASGTPTGERD
jgi:chromosome segregation ATPase